MFWRFAAIACCSVLVLATPACIRPYKSPISQGNLIRQEDIKRLKIGMTREQVIFLVGKPILSQPFEKTRWDYVFMYRHGYRQPVQKNLVLWFNGDKLAKIENHYPALGTGEPSESDENIESDNVLESDINLK